MIKIGFQNLPNTTTPVNASNLNQLQINVENDINTRAKTIYKEYVMGNTTNIISLASDGVYLIMAHSNGNNVCGFDVVVSANNAIYKTSLYTNQYISITYSGTSVTISPQFSTFISILKL